MTRHELAARLARRLRPPGTRASDALHAALAPFATPEAVRDLLCGTLRDEQWLDAVRDASYRHDNGFDKIVLMAGAGYQFRLHVWREVPREAEVENVHNHRWDFSSVILLGGYRFQEFTPDPGGCPFHAYGYVSERGSASYSLEALGQRGLTRSFDAHLRAGTSYTLTSDVLHRVSNPPGRLTMSLVLQGPHQPDSAVLVYAEKRLPSGRTLPRAGFSHEDLRHLLGDLVDELADPLAV
ncbi:hypothetical protein [Actinomadura sp. WMMA1423]|uniref:hypothetical protein n=1 Tax=Actinomadura sp. WMMA1423 TaxID=2591108 RepID=UPI0011465ED1|nr:hypothetical protein [Actinomadura sp. WMMA1423]